MAVGWVSDVAKGAIRDEAAQLAVRHLSAEFAEVRAEYGIIKFDIGAECLVIKALTDEATTVMNKQKSAQNLYELESQERRDVAQKVREWMGLLQAASQFALLTDHPLGPRLPKRAFTGEVDLESWRQAIDGIGAAIEAITEEGLDAETIGLTPDFVAEGRAIFAQMVEERDDAALAESRRLLLTRRLDEIFEEIVKRFEKINAARNLVMLRTKRELPGFELSLVKAAAGPNRDPNTPPTAPATGL